MPDLKNISLKVLKAYIFVFLLLMPGSLFAQADSTAVSNPENLLDPSINQLQELFSLSKIVSILFTIGLAYFAVRFVTFLLEKLAENQINYRLFIKRLIPFINVIAWSIAIFVIIVGIINPPFETIITVSASIGIAVGFAAQDILKNIFGGFLIIIDRPFQVGDKIEVGQYYGEVSAIGLRTTRITTPDDSLITVPNAMIVNSSVSNANAGALYCQVVSSIFIDRDENLADLKEIAYRAAITSRYVYMNKPVTIIVENKIVDRQNMIELKIKAYVLDIRYEFLMKSEITDLILSELNKRRLQKNENNI
jgi:small-conductance mechanosensitive channel